MAKTTDKIHKGINEFINGTIKKRLKKEIWMLSEHRFITVEIIRRLFKISRRTAHRDIVILKELGLIEFVGARKTGRYVLTEKGEWWGR